MEAPLADRPEESSSVPREAEIAEDRSKSFVRSVLSRVGPWDLFLLAMILLLAIKVNCGTSIVHDIGLGDEARYLSAGIRLDLARAQYSPLYSGWYYLLSSIAPDPVDLYYLNWFLLPLMLALGLYAFVRSLGGPALLAFLGAALILLSQVYDVSTRPMHFAASFVLFGLAAAFMFRTMPTRIAVATLTLGVASFARPEFAVSFLFLAAVLCVVLAWECYRNPRDVARLAALGVIALLPVLQLHQIFGDPLGGNRSDIAFGQHYVLNKHDAGLIDPTLSVWHNYRKIIKEDFGVADVGIVEAIKLAPGNVLWHVRRNVVNLFRDSAGMFQVRQSADVTWAMRGYLALLILGAGAIAAFQIRRKGWRNIAVVSAAPTLVGVAVLGPVVAGCLIIYPRDHYLVCVTVVSLAMLSAMMGAAATRRRQRFPGGVAVLMVVGVVLLAPNQNVGWNFRMLTDAEMRETFSPRKPVLHVVQLLREIPFKADPAVMEYGYCHYVYTDHDFTFHMPTQIHAGNFATYLEEKQIDAVTLSPFDLKIGALRTDASYKTFRESPPPGWVVFGEPDATCRIAVRRDSLTGAPPENIVAAPTDEARL